MRKNVFCAVLMLVAGMALAQNLQNLRNLRNLGGANLPRTGTAPSAQKQEAQSQMTREELKSVPRGTNGVPTLAFNQAPLDLVLEAYAAEVGKTVIPAPDLPKATITLRSLEDQVLTKEEYLEAIEVMLTMNGVVLEPRGEKFLRALPRKTVRTHGIPLLMQDKGNLPEQGRVVSQMIQFKNIAVDEAQKALEGFKAPEGLFQVFERTNAILVTDTQENINRMLEVVRAIDIATPVTEDVFVRQIEYALSTDIKTHLEEIVKASQEEAQQKKSGPASSGPPRISSSTPATPSGRLLNFNNLPGIHKQEQPASTPNANLIAAVSDADRGMIRGKVLILADERSNKLIIITSKSNMDFFDKVIKTLDVETTPEVQIDVIRLKYADAEDVEQMLNELIGASGPSSQNKNNQNANTQKGGAANSNLTRGTTQNAQRRTGSSNSPTFQNANASRLGELNKDNVKVLADKRINGIVVMARKADMRAIREVIDNMDVKLSQVLIETAIIEITLTDELSTGIDWIMGQEVAKSKLVPFYQHGQMIGGGGVENVSALGSFANPNGKSPVPIASGIKYMVKSSKLNLASVITAAKNDSRAKYVASPIIMTVDNKEATIDATENRQFVTGWSPGSSSGYGSYSTPSPNYSSKDIGIKIKVTPKINPNGTVMLTVEEEYSRYIADGQSMLIPGSSSASSNVTAGGTTQYTKGTVDLAVERKMSADIRLENMQTVVFGGLTETSTSESENGIPILKDIPWVGKWLFSDVKQTETRKELLVFMTPYVLDDEDSAQLEAVRRKKSLSDPNPWDDHGWSASPLADPVSQKEQLRRFKDEWKRQDDERKTKLAIEKAKVERAQKLEKMSKEEREAWIEIHKEELEKERKEAFEKRVEEQKELQTFVEDLKKKDLETAEQEIQKADNAAVQDNKGGEKKGFEPEK